MKSKVSKIVKLIFLLSVFCNLQSVFSQSPQKMSYQAVIRNGANVLVSNSTVGIKISILQGSASGTPVYIEVHSATTNANGLATLEIGGGAIVSGNFSTINWANGPYFIKTETDPLGGINYTISGTSQMLSVPYALFAEKTNPDRFVSSEDYLGGFRTVRNTWVDYPNVSIIVPTTGKYMLSFHGGASEPNIYNSLNGPDYDYDCKVRVFNVTSSAPLFEMRASMLMLDISTNGSDNYTVFRYILGQPSRFMIVNLTAGNELRIQYNQEASPTNALTTSWFMYDSGLSILKLD